MDTFQEVGAILVKSLYQCLILSDALIVDGVGRGGSLLDDVALVELHLALAGHVLLGGFHESLACFAQRGEPLCGVNDISELVADIFFHCHGLFVEDQLLQLLMSCQQDGSSGSLINTTGLHADHTVFYDIGDADSVLAAQLVQLGDDLGKLHFLAV